MGAIRRPLPSVPIAPPSRLPCFGSKNITRCPSVFPIFTAPPHCLGIFLQEDTRYFPFLYVKSPHRFRHQNHLRQKLRWLPPTKAWRNLLTQRNCPHSACCGGSSSSGVQRGYRSGSASPPFRLPNLILKSPYPKSVSLVRVPFTSFFQILGKGIPLKVLFLHVE